MIPTFQAFRESGIISSCIDVTLTLGSIQIENWRVDQRFNGSDHRTITWSVPLQLPPAELIRPWSKGKWKEFREILQNYDFNYPENFTTRKTDKFLDKIYKQINKALDQTCEKRPAKQHKPEAEWFTKDQRRLRNRAKRKHQALLRSGSRRAQAAAKRARRAYHRSCKRAKRNSWRMFVEKTPDEANMAVLARIARRKDKRTINTLRRANGGISNPGEETIKILTDAHFRDRANATRQ